MITKRTVFLALAAVLLGVFALFLSRSPALASDYDIWSYDTYNLYEDSYMKTNGWTVTNDDSSVWVYATSEVCTFQGDCTVAKASYCFLNCEGSPPPTDFEFPEGTPPPTTGGSGCTLSVGSSSGLTVTFQESSPYYHGRHLWDFTSDGTWDQTTDVSGHTVNYTYPSPGTYRATVAIQDFIDIGDFNNNGTINRFLARFLGLRAARAAWDTIASCWVEISIAPTPPPTITKSHVGGNCLDTPVLLGSNATFTLAPYNAGAPAMTVTDTLPSQLTYNASGTSPPPSSISGQTLSWSYPAGTTSAVITLSATASSVGTATNQAQVSNQNGQSSTSCTVVIGTALTIQGDVLARSQINKISVTGPAVVVAGGTISNLTTSGSIFTIPSYQNVVGLQDSARQAMNANIDRLLTERARSYGSNTLTSESTSSLDVGGRVYRIPSGNFFVGGNVVGGRITYIIENGDLVINGNLTNGGGSLPGFVVLCGNVTIANSVTNFSAAIYAPNRCGAAGKGIISFAGGVITPLSAYGAYIGQGFTFGSRNMSIIYNGSLALNPPPGFVNLVSPVFQELAP